MVNRYWVSIRENKKVLEITSGNCHITMWMYLMPLNCKLKNGQNGNFCYIRYTTIKKRRCIQGAKIDRIFTALSRMFLRETGFKKKHTIKNKTKKL